MLELPDHLADRIRYPGTSAFGSGYVLYWMHHAVRDHDNAALDTACFLADRLKRPLLVYQGLGGKHPHNNDRHFSFILEGARDVACRLSAKGIRHTFFLPEDPCAESPLRELAADAAVVVTEDFPAPPFPRWGRRLAETSGTPVLQVDTHCIVPMRSVGQRFDRAFRFREATRKKRKEELSREWSHVPAPMGHKGPLPFEPLDWRKPIHELIAPCRIDHGVAPVTETPGGSSAGYARWNSFQRDGLAAYHRLRNNAAVRGVSRMSPYLHHGHVSPWRLARDAEGMGGRGAEKFLDELLTWRELAFNFAFHTDDPGAWQALPAWARETLEEHRPGRPAGPLREQLRRGTTGVELWDLAQKSLVHNGELHNNLRMTWGKQLAAWGEDPHTSLQNLLDLNNRFSLDGSDPNSYAGLLWCLGLFDRPFPPARPALGLVRPREVASHAKRLDVSAYRCLVESVHSRPRVGIVGAGMAGLAAGRVLQDHGCNVTLFDKGRRAGGRMASRDRDGWAFDHGAQYFTARDPRFRSSVEAWLEACVAAPWEGRIGSAEEGIFQVSSGSHERFVGVPEMNALAAHMAQDLDVRIGSHVELVTWADSEWRISTNQATFGPFDAVIAALPQPQAEALLGPPVPNATMEPCWAIMLGFESPLETEFDGLFVNEGPISWLARNTAKPGRGDRECWVVHAAPAWSRAHLEWEPENVVETLLDAFREVLGAIPTPRLAKAHRWRFAQGSAPLAEEAWWDPSRRLAVAGDWLAGGRVEGAWLSGVAAAGFILREPELNRSRVMPTQAASQRTS